jgi:hypothetical protein
MVAPVMLAGIAAVLLAPAHAGDRASRVVDSTYSCAAGFVGGLHQVTVRSSYSATPGAARLRVSSSIATNIYESLGSLSADGFTLHRGLCVPAKATVKLTTKGMRGGAVPPLGAEATCETPRRLLLRVRAVFKRPVTPQTSRQFGFPQLVATGQLENAAFAVGTPAGRTVAYLSVAGTEKARFFTVRTCKED